jgi:hypothetical protein
MSNDFEDLDRRSLLDLLEFGIAAFAEIDRIIEYVFDHGQCENVQS